MSYIDKFKNLAKQEWSQVVQKEVREATNYNESLVPDYTLPSCIIKNNGNKVKTAFEWMVFRRPAVLEMFKKEMYGEVPPLPDKTRYELISIKENALDGTAVRKEIRIHFEMNSGKSHFIDMLLYVPKNADKPVPAFIGLNFKGNHACSDEEDINPTGGRLDSSLLDKEHRGIQTYRWHFKELISKGYAAATICYHDIFPDRNDGWHESIFELFEDLNGTCGAHEHYSAIGAWAWGLSRGLDCLETETAIDTSRIAVHGHSRLGKTALWVGACDQRFKIVISNDSGCGGAAVSRRMFGETFLFMVNMMPHWFVKGFRKYAANENNLPFDQHWLLSLSAPRPLVVASASEDLWADPKGEFLSAYHAGEVYRLFGAPVIETEEMPHENQYLTSAVSYHVRTGKHDQTAFDWKHFVEIADKYL
jgi:hypothetical protein